MRRFNRFPTCEGPMEHAFIADTNLFFECKRLEELPWSDLAVDPVILALIKPVMAEIDKHKKGNGRARKRAIEISGRIRGMLMSPSPEVVIQEAGPRVVLRLMPIVLPDPELSSSLDYSINDDRIVGTVATLSKVGTFTSVSMLTDDSVAASTAHSLGISFHMIPESWKRPSEETTEAKRIKELEKDISIYRAQEPLLNIEDASGDTVRANVVRRVALALEPSEIDQLIEKLKARHPIQQDFVAPESEIEADGTEISYEAPDAEVIEKYTVEAYPSWINVCRSVFENLHNGRIEHEPEVALKFSITNSGTRPASKMRVSFEAVGDIHLSRGSHDQNSDDPQEDDVRQSGLSQIPQLPSPPVAPAVRQIVKRPSAVSRAVAIASLRPSRTALRASELAKAAQRNMSIHPRILGAHNTQSILENLHGRGVLADLLHQTNSISDMARIVEGPTLLQRSPFGSLGFDRSAYRDVLVPHASEMHDPEEFYYDKWPKAKPTKRGALTCDLFRHRRDKKNFEVNVLFPDDGNVSGAVRCIVEAENLTKPAELLLPVNRSIELYSLAPIAEQMVERCGL